MAIVIDITMALLNITLNLDGESDVKGIKYTPHMSRIAYGLSNTAPVYFLPWVKMSRPLLVEFAKKTGLNNEDDHSLARLFLVPKYLEKMLDTMPRLPKGAPKEEKTKLAKENIRLLLNLIFPIGSALYIHRDTFTVEGMHWEWDDAVDSIIDRNAPKTRKRGSTTSSKKRGGAPGTATATSPRRGVSLIYKITVNLQVTKGVGQASLERRVRSSCQVKRKQLRETLKNTLNIDIGKGSFIKKKDTGDAPQMFSTNSSQLIQRGRRRGPSSTSTYSDEWWRNPYYNYGHSLGRHPSFYPMSFPQVVSSHSSPSSLKQHSTGISMSDRLARR